MWGAFFWFRIGIVVLLPLIPTKYAHGFGLMSNISWMSGWIGADFALSFVDQKTQVAQNSVKMQQGKLKTKSGVADAVIAKKSM
jgi:hypothetical protein